MSSWRAVIWLLLYLFSASAPTLAQTNAACGLPAEGSIREATYTLTADCAQTGKLTIANRIPAQTVTINGGGHTIRMDGDETAIIWGPGAILNLNNVTIDSNNKSHISGAIRAGTITANNVSFINNNGGVAFRSEQATLTNVYFAWNRSSGFSLGGNGSAIQVNAIDSLTLTNAVFRNNIGNGGAIAMLAGATLTTNGCLTLSGNVPYDVYAPDGTTWTNTSTGACTGTIGNGDQAVIPAPALMTCGFPASGNLDASATYTLTADCALTGVYYISEDVSIRVIGNGRAIRSSRTGYSFVTAATSSLRLENVALEGIRFYNWGNFAAERIKASATNGGILLNMGEARIANGLFESNTSRTTGGRSVALAYNAYQKGGISFTDASFRGNTGGLGVLATFGAAIELNGCIHFEDNSPADTYIYAGRGGVVNDNRASDCDATIVDPLIPVLPPAPNAPPSDSPEAKCNNPPCELPAAPKQDECNLKLGAIGVICYPNVQPPVAQVWQIRRNPEGDHLPAVGTFILAVDQPQVEAVAEGLVACSPDGRVAVRTGLPPEIRYFFEISPKYEEELKIPRRYIVISKGPTFEGKVHNLVLDHRLDGPVFGFVDTYEGPPGSDCAKNQPAAAKTIPLPTPTPVYAPPVQPQAPQPDGSIVHIVQAGDTISAIAVAYRVRQLDIIMVNQLEKMGRWIYPGQELIIREAA